MKPEEGAFDDLRLVAKAADRSKAATEQWPAFEQRLRELGYGPREIARAFRTLSGPGTVTQALETLRAPTPKSHRVELTFDVTETRRRPSSANRVTITSVERDNTAIHVNYDVVPPPGLNTCACAEATDDLGNHYSDLGGLLGLTRIAHSAPQVRSRACGRLDMPLPVAAATRLDIRISWHLSNVDGPTQVSVSLPK